MPNLRRAASALVLGAAVLLAGQGILPAQAGSDGIWISRARLLSLPTSGAAWSELLTIASATAVAGNPSLIDQDSTHSRNSISFLLTDGGTDSAVFAAREAGAATAPLLRVTIAD